MVKTVIVTISRWTTWWRVET